jgi:hypothetical protein
MINYFLVEDNASINSDALFVTDFMNLKIKLEQPFECAHRNRVCVRIHIQKMKLSSQTTSGDGDHAQHTKT